MLKVTTALILLVLITAALSGSVEAGSEPVSVRAAKCLPVFLRQQKDPRLCLHDELLDKRDVLHIYLTLADEPFAYTFSLGYFTFSEGSKEPGLIDEHEQLLPVPGAKATHFDKSDLHEVKGFDLVSAGKVQQALKEFASAVKQPQSNPRLYSNLGACLAQLGQFADAGKQLDLAIKMKPDYAVALANKSWLCLATGRAVEAATVAQAALRIDPDLRAARFAAIKAQLDLGQPAGAHEVSENTVLRWPGDPYAIKYSGDVLAAAGNFKLAKARYQKALLLMPNNPQLLLEIAQAAAVQGDLDDALKRARQATTVAPDNPAGHLALGRYLEMNRENRAAQIQYERALDLNPSLTLNVSIYGPLLRVLVAGNKLDDADKLSRKWVAGSPDCGDCHYNRAWIAAQLPGPKHTVEAIDEYKKAIAIKADLTSAHYNVALLLVKQEKESEAARELKLFIQLAPKDPDIGNARKLLEKLGK